MLSNEETVILSKALSFCPESDVDKFEVIKDLQFFARKLILKSVYSKDIMFTDEKTKSDKALDDLISLLDEQDDIDLIDRVHVDSLFNAHITIHTDNQATNSKLKKKSDKFPSPNLNTNLGVFLAMTTKEIKKININVSEVQIMSVQDKLAIKTLTNQHQLTIKPADKGANIVIMSNIQNKAMCLKILKNKEWYRPIPRSLIERYNKEFYILVDNAYLNYLIKKQTWDFIRTPHPKIPTFYSLPKNSQK